MRTREGERLVSLVGVQGLCAAEAERAGTAQPNKSNRRLRTVPARS